MNKVFDSGLNVKVNDSNKWRLEDITDMYQKYIASLGELDEKSKLLFLKGIKLDELKNNQETECEDRFAMELQLLSQRQNSIDLTMRLLEKGIITREDVKTIHGWVIKGSSDDVKENYPFRSDNERWVGSFNTNGSRNVDYMPPDYNDIATLLNELLGYLNSPNTSENDIFVKPFIAHALLGYLQPFNNGNTRLARVMQHGKIITGTNEVLGTDFKKPIFYLSRNYLMTRPQYRDFLKYVAVDQNNEAWNNWIKYNLNMTNEQLYYLGNQLDSYKKRVLSR